MKKGIADHSQDTVAVLWPEHSGLTDHRAWSAAHSCRCSTPLVLSPQHGFWGDAVFPECLRPGTLSAALPVPLSKPTPSFLCSCPSPEPLPETSRSQLPTHNPRSQPHCTG